MEENRREVKVTEVTMTCKKCGKDNLKFMDKFSVGRRDVYLHICNDCGENNELLKKYPYYEYEKINDKIL
jgi:hypothetical protein